MGGDALITLGFDSTAKVAAVAVAEDDRLLATYQIHNGLTQSELLLPMAEDMLRSLHLSFSDVGLLCCSVGPGSFTGVRIGVSLVKGLAFGKNLPCVAVSTLEALAENLAGLAGVIVACMDARRGQVYRAIFSSDGEALSRLTEDGAVSLDELVKELEPYRNRDIRLVGDGYDVTAKELTAREIPFCGTPVLLREENAASVVRIAYRDYLLGKAESDLTLSPVYLRLPQAERERLKREKAKKE